MSEKLQTLIFNFSLDISGEEIVTVQSAFRDGTTGNICSQFDTFEEAVESVLKSYRYKLPKLSEEKDDR